MFSFLPLFADAQFLRSILIRIPIAMCVMLLGNRGAFMSKELADILHVHTPLAKLRAYRMA